MACSFSRHWHTLSFRHGKDPGRSPDEPTRALEIHSSPALSSGTHSRPKLLASHGSPRASAGTPASVADLRTQPKEDRLSRLTCRAWPCPAVPNSPDSSAFSATHRGRSLLTGQSVERGSCHNPIQCFVGSATMRVRRQGTVGRTPIHRKGSDRMGSRCAKRTGTANWCAESGGG